MFISAIKEENICKEELVSLYKSKFKKGNDVVNQKRNIILHNDINFNKSTLESVHSIKCSIINLSVLEGVYHYDTMTNPELILAKTTYNGYMQVPLNLIEGELVLSETLLSESKFMITNAYTSYLGLWSVHSGHDTFTPIGMSILNMQDLINSKRMFSKNHISMFNTNIVMKVEVSFDGKDFYNILPIPYPQYYSRIHSELNHDDPIITRNIVFDMEDLCDEHTKVSVIDFGEKINIEENVDQYVNDINTQLTYHNSTGGELIPSNQDISPRLIFSTLRSQCDELYGKIYKLFTQYQLSSLNFIYDSKRDYFSTQSMTFSFKEAPKGFAKTVCHEIICDSDTLNCLSGFANLYGHLRIFGRVTDLKYDLNLIFYDKVHKELPDLKCVRYRASVFDILNSLIDFGTSIKEPISSIINY